MVKSSISQDHARQSAFLTLLPTIERTARWSCRELTPEVREDAIAEAVASAFVAFVRLEEQHRTEAANGRSLARFAVRQFFAGRRVGSSLNSKDILSEYARRGNRFCVERLDRRDERGNWRDVLVEDHRATPADLAASRIDFPAWLKTLPTRDRRIALKLADGHSTGAVASRFKISVSRVSQLRRELADRWQEFHETPSCRTGATAAV